MRHSIAWPLGRSSRSGSRSSRSPRANPDLPTDEVEAGHHLGDRVLDLETRVHLEEIEAAILVEQELDGAGVGCSRPPWRRRAAAEVIAARSAGETASDASPRRPSGDGAGSNTRARRTAARCRRIAEQLHLDVGAAAVQHALEIHRRVANAAPASDPRRAPRGQVSRVGDVRMPLPPPPATAFTSNG